MLRTLQLSHGLIPFSLLAAASLGCGGDDLVLPQPPSAKDFRVSAISGTSQVGTVGEPLPNPLVVEVRDQRDQPVSGWKVAFVPTQGAVAGTVSPDTAETNEDGRASSRWVLGTTPGTYTVDAQLVPTDSSGAPGPAQFQASAHAGAADSMAAVSAQNQPGRREEELPEPVVVKLLDRFGNPVPGVNVHWEVQSGDGEVSDSDVVTDDSGQAGVRWLLGDRLGVQKLSASAEGDLKGSPIVFTAVVLF